MLRVDLTTYKRDRVMDGCLAIRCRPEAPAALGSLRDAGVRLAFPSNMTQTMLEAGIRNSGLEGVFDHVRGRTWGDSRCHGRGAPAIDASDSAKDSSESW